MVTSVTSPYAQSNVATVDGLPAAGNRSGESVNNAGSNGNYWSSTRNNETNAYNLNFTSGTLNPQNNNNRYNGFAVRAVQAF